MAAPIFPTDEELEGLLVGPESVTWRFASDARLYLGMLYPLLLQVAHPTVAAGVHDFSDFEQRPWERLLRTLDYVTLLAYGGHDAVAAGRRLRALHKQFRGKRADGRPYSALEPTAYAWVHATVLDSYVAGHERFGTPMTRAQKERFYREYRGLGRLIGVRERDLPGDWGGFRRYFDEMIDGELTRTESVDRVLRSVTKATPPPMPLPDLLWRTVRFPAQRALWLGGIGLLPPALRERLGISWSLADELAFRTLGTAMRSTTPLMPQRLRVMGPRQLEVRRRAIAWGPLGESGGAISGPTSGAVATA
ncbi:MAG: DUF2236 domain-containing protein [Solirubrobacterales bacterium]|nr:DUF2236 domain-containing protein [Solirubrobacterales bacterium]